MNDAPSFRHDCVILDASTVINLYATGRMTEIIRSLPARSAVSSFVKEKEALFVQEPSDEIEDRQRTPIELGSLIAAGLLEVCSHNSPSIANNIIVLADAGIRGMGETISAAIALNEGWGIVLDDRSATKKLLARFPHIQTLTTFHLIKYWANEENVKTVVISEVLKNIRIRANYDIARDHPLYAWVSCHDN